MNDRFGHPAGDDVLRRVAALLRSLVRKGDGKDVDHKRMLKDGGTNTRSNLRVKSQHWNRGWRGREKP